MTTSSPSPAARRAAAERQRRYRARRREGKVCLKVYVDHVETAEALLDCGLLSPDDYDDAAKLSEALSKARIRILGAAE